MPRNPAGKPAMPPLEMEVYLAHRRQLMEPPFGHSTARIAAAYVVAGMLERYAVEDEEALDRTEQVITDSEESED